MNNTPPSICAEISRAKYIPVTLALLSAFAGSASAQSFVNGGFEKPIISSDSPGGTLFVEDQISGWQIAKGGDVFLVSSPSKEHGVGAPDVSGSVQKESGGTKEMDPIKGMDAKYSNQYASNLLTTVGSGLYNSILSQTVSGFSSKTEYTLNYSIADYYGNDKLAALLDVSIYNSSGELIGMLHDSIESKVGFGDESVTGNESTAWEQRSINFTANDDKLTFSFDFGPKAYEEYASLDLKDGSKEGGKYYYTAGLDSVSITAVPEPSSVMLLGALGTLSMFRRRRAH